MTISSTIYDTINNNWGNGGYAGTAPAIINSESEKVRHEGYNKTDIVEVRHFTRRLDPRPVNDTYTDKYYTVTVRISSKTSAAQLKLIYDEVEYLLRNETMTSLQLVNIRDDYVPTDSSRGFHAVDMRVEVVTLMASGKVSPAGAADTNVFVLRDGTEPLTGNWDAGSYEVRAQTFESDVATGTAPFTIASTTVSTNLNADLWDGKQLADHTTNDAAPHSNISHVDLDDTTLTGAQLEDSVSFGAANAAWVNCPLEGWDTSAGAFDIGSNGVVHNTGATDGSVFYGIPLEPTRGTLKLYISGTKVALADADATDYINDTYVLGFATQTVSVIDRDQTNKTTVDVHTDTFTAVDCSTYYGLRVRLDAVNATSGELEIAWVSVQYYYA